MNTDRLNDERLLTKGLAKFASTLTGDKRIFVYLTFSFLLEKRCFLRTAIWWISHTDGLFRTGIKSKCVKLLESPFDGSY